MIDKTSWEGWAYVGSGNLVLSGFDGIVRLDGGPVAVLSSARHNERLFMWAMDLDSSRCAKNRM